MPKKQPQLAKLSRPRTHKPVARERLFRLLDEKREHPVVWVAGPPGAGKTTLVASYLEEAGVPAIWYQMDSGDSDPATFFLYLKKAVEHLAQSGSRLLPALTPEYLADLPGFARRFIRAAFMHAPPDALLVFDNYHEISQDSPLHAAFGAMLDEVPRDSNLVIASRATPPAPFAPMVVNGQIAELGWDDLRLTEPEARQLVAQRGSWSDTDVRLIHTRSGGWMAGVILMTEQGDLEDGRTRAFDARSLETAFNYFADLVFNRSDQVSKDILVRAALMPRVTGSVLHSVMDDADAIKVIEQLHRRHLFTDRLSVSSPAYRFHALFHAFLKAKAQEMLSDNDRREVLLRAAVAFAKEGAPEEAFVLYVEAQSWVDAERMFVNQAPGLTAQGRWRTLRDWADLLPSGRKDKNPTLTYWLGRAEIAVDPRRATAILQKSYEGFSARRESTGQLLSAAAAIESIYYAFDDFRPMDGWLAKVGALYADSTLLRTEQEKLWAYAAIVLGGTIRSPGHAHLRPAVERIVELLDGAQDDNVKMAGATILMMYSTLSMDERATAVAVGIARPILTSPAVAPIRASFYISAEGYCHYVHGKYDEALRCYADSDRIALDNGLADTTANTGLWRLLCLRRMGLLADAEAELGRLAGSRSSANGYFSSMYKFARAVICFDKGELESAVSLALEAQLSFDAGGQTNASTMAKLGYAYMLVASGHLDEAVPLLADCKKLATGTVFDNIVGAVVLNEAWIALKRARWEECESLLRAALVEAEKSGSRARIRWYPKALSELLPIAFQNGICEHAASRLVRECDLRPGNHAEESWPWRVKIHTLGRFQLLVDGRQPDYSRKVPRKVLALLKAIVVFGGQDIPEKKLMDALWPDDDGDAARRSLTATLHRLRRLLSASDAIMQSEGRLSLNFDCCWVDALSLERQFDGGRGTVPDPDVVIALYRGTFLDQEDASWVVPAREKLRARFIQAVGQRGASLEAGGQFERAAAIYQRGIEADGLIESFYQGVMRCLGRLDRKAEAASAFRRLRQTLSVTLGVQPSAMSQRMFDSLQSR